MSQREFILCAAVHYRDGKKYKEQPLNIESGIVVLGRRHNNCLYTLSQIKDFEIDLVTRGDFGFITSLNEFKTRKEAMVIALREKQIWHTISFEEGDILTSEDLYFECD